MMIADCSFSDESKPAIVSEIVRNRALASNTFLEPKD